MNFTVIYCRPIYSGIFVGNHRNGLPLASFVLFHFVLNFRILFVAILNFKDPGRSSSGEWWVLATRIDARIDARIATRINARIASRAATG